MQDLHLSVRRAQGARGLLGNLNFACRVIPMELVFCHCLSMATAGVSVPSHFVRLSFGRIWESGQHSLMSIMVGHWSWRVLCPTWTSNFILMCPGLMVSGLSFKASGALNGWPIGVRLGTVPTWHGSYFSP